VQFAWKRQRAELLDGPIPDVLDRGLDKLYNCLLSWLVQRAWRHTRAEIAKLKDGPSAHG
jgi:hypothetical protein